VVAKVTPPFEKSRTGNCHRFVTSWFLVRGKVPIPAANVVSKTNVAKGDQGLAGRGGPRAPSAPPVRGLRREIVAAPGRDRAWRDDRRPPAGQQAG
jgi:hypothetical protein